MWKFSLELDLLITKSGILELLRIEGHPTLHRLEYTIKLISYRDTLFKMSHFIHKCKTKVGFTIFP